MPNKMHTDDEIRLNVLEALLKKGAVVPNLKQIQRQTGYHKATIKSSIDFLEKSEILEGFGPKINFRKFGYKLEVIELLQADLSKKKLFEQFLDAAKKDPCVYRITAVVGSGNWNLFVRHIYRDIESYHRDMQKNYFEAIPGIYDFIKDRQIFYATEPLFKNISRTNAIIEIARKEKGLNSKTK